MPDALYKLMEVAAKMEEALHGDLPPSDQEPQPAPAPKPPKSEGEPPPEASKGKGTPEPTQEEAGAPASAEQERSPESKPESKEEVALKNARDAYARVYVGFSKEKSGLGKIPKGAELEEILKEARAASHISPRDAGIIWEWVEEPDEKQIDQAYEGRSVFIRTLVEKGVGEEIASWLYCVEAHKVAYDSARLDLSSRLRTEKEAELKKKILSEAGKSPDADLSDEEKAKLKEQLDHYVASEIFEKVVAEEHALLDKARVESWPPRERGRLESAARALAGWWLRRNWLTRVAISSAVITAAIAATPGLGFASVSAAAGYAGFRGGRGVLSVLSGQTVGEIFELIAKGTIVRKGKKRLAATRETLAEEYKANPLTLDALHEAEEGYRKAREKLARTERRLLYAKSVVMVGAGMGTAWLAGYYGTPRIGTVTGEVAPGKPALVHAEPSPKPSPSPSPSPSPAAIEQLPRTRDMHELVRTPEAPSKTDVLAAKPAAPAEVAGRPAPEAAPPAEVLAPEEEAKKLAGLAEVRKGDGAWRVVHRQLEYRLDHHPDKFEASAGARLGMRPEDVQKMMETDAGKARLLDRLTSRIVIDEGWASRDATPTSGTLKGVYFDERLKTQAHLTLTEDDKIRVDNPRAVFDVRKPAPEALSSPGGFEPTVRFGEPLIKEVPSFKVPPPSFQEWDAAASRGAGAATAHAAAEAAAYDVNGGRQDFSIIAREMKLSPERFKALHDVTAHDLLAESRIPKDFLRLKHALASLRLAGADQQMTIQELFEQRGTEIRYAYEHHLDFKHPVRAEMLIEEAAKDHGSWLRRILHFPKDDYRAWAKGKTSAFVKTMLEGGEGRAPREQFLLARAIDRIPAHHKAFYDIGKMTLKDLFGNKVLRGEIVSAYATLKMGV